MSSELIHPADKTDATPVVSSSAAGLSDTVSAPAIIAAAFDKLGIAFKVRLLSRLLGAVGPLALAVLGGGIFAKYVERTRWPEIPISLDDAARLTSGQIYELARYVEQSNPHVIDALFSMLSQDAMAMTAIGASLIAMAIGRQSAASRSR